MAACLRSLRLGMAPLVTGGAGGGNKHLAITSHRPAHTTPGKGAIVQGVKKLHISTGAQKTLFAPQHQHSKARVEEVECVVSCGVCGCAPSPTILQSLHSFDPLGFTPCTHAHTLDDIEVQCTNMDTTTTTTTTNNNSSSIGTIAHTSIHTFRLPSNALWYPKDTRQLANGSRQLVNGSRQLVNGSRQLGNGSVHCSLTCSQIDTQVMDGISKEDCTTNTLKSTTQKKENWLTRSIENGNDLSNKEVTRCSFTLGSQSNVNNNICEAVEDSYRRFVNTDNSYKCNEENYHRDSTKENGGNAMRENCLMDNLDKGMLEYSSNYYGDLNSTKENGGNTIKENGLNAMRENCLMDNLDRGMLEYSMGDLDRGMLGYSVGGMCDMTMLKSVEMREDMVHRCTGPSPPLSSPPTVSPGGVSSEGGKPSPEQLSRVFNELADNLPKLFTHTQNYTIYSQDIVFENRIRGVKTVGLYPYLQQLSLLRIAGHFKFAFVKFNILKITKHPDEGVVKVRWRIVGMTGLKAIRQIWKLKSWGWSNVEEHMMTWYDGFSTFHVGQDGLVHLHVADNMMPDEEKQSLHKDSLTVRIASLFGLLHRPNRGGLSTSTTTTTTMTTSDATIQI